MRVWVSNATTAGGRGWRLTDAVIDNVIDHCALKLGRVRVDGYHRRNAIWGDGRRRGEPPQPPPLHGVGEQSNTETASRTCGGTLAGFNVPAPVLFCRIRASAREERSEQARGKAREGTGEKEGEGPPRCFSCSPIRYINIPNRDSRRRVLRPAVSWLRNPPENGVLGLFSLIGQHGTVLAVLTTISIRAETKRESEIDWS
ncbi:hypothetical protein ALC57_16329 [Trachymyrmex cornetzi]|uniref:Uncharacterized protein n=1 Tax=Trachymyrmex cornetzi TaxID=471704 RepID=A0A195DF66_9HYME|nr:hypothetical protein ALC57_16329 [Trachymyrmex cornetzi]